MADPSRVADGDAALGGPWSSFTCGGTRIDALPFERAVEALCTPSGPRAVHLCNAYTLSLTARDGAFAAGISRGDLNLPDGMPLVWVARRLGIPLEGRVYGPDLMAAVLDRGRAAGLRHHLYGSTPEVLDALRRRIEQRWPGAEVVGAESPPFRPLEPAEEDALVERIRAVAPDVVWVGLGTPKQDLFVDRFRDRLGTTLVAVGAAFDFHAGTLRQAPPWMQQRGLEWLYRLLREPRRLWRRYLIGNAVFVGSLLRHRPRRLPTGELRGLVVVAGPDGAGKSSLADAVAALAADEGTVVHRAHARPGILVGRGGDGAPVTEPHAQPPRGLPASLAKLALSIADVWLAVAGPWRRQRARGLVLWERGWHDQLVDPARYRLHPGTRRLAGVLAGLVPRADAVVVATGDPAAIHERKPELDVAELDRQLRRWEALAARVGRRVVTVDTVESDVDAAAKAVAAELLAPPPAAPIRPLRRVPLTPDRLGLAAAGPHARAALSIYRPLRPSAAAAFAAGRRVRRLGAVAPDRLGDVAGALRPLAPDADSWAVMQSSARGRVVVGAAGPEGLVLVAKVGDLDDDRLANEAHVLDGLAGADLGVAVPSVRWHGTHGQHRLLALEPLALGPAVDDPEVVLAVCVALAESGVAHGDLAPWNLWHGPDGPVLVDWEAARSEPAPLDDLAHWLIQRGALLDRATPGQVAADLTGAGSVGARCLDRLGIDRHEAIGGLAARLRDATDDPTVAPFRRRVAELLA